MQQPVSVQGVAGPGHVEAQGQPVATAGMDHAIDHFLGLPDAHSILLRQSHFIRTLAQLRGTGINPEK